MVLTAYFALSPEIGLFCLRRLRSCLHKLDTGVEAPGPHDLAVRGMMLRLQHYPRPPHPAPRFVTLRNAPIWDGTG
jgi:hypothetical protein